MMVQVNQPTYEGDFHLGDKQKKKRKEKKKKNLIKKSKYHILYTT
jgi:hypothetical protein